MAASCSPGGEAQAPSSLPEVLFSCSSAFLILEKYKNLVQSVCWRHEVPAFVGQVSGVLIPTQLPPPAKATKGRGTRRRFRGEKATGLHR